MASNRLQYLTNYTQDSNKANLQEHMEKGQRLFTAVVVFLFAMSTSTMQQFDARMSPDDISVWRQISAHIVTDKTSYRLAETIILTFFLKNDEGDDVYVDSRMFWTGLSGGRQLQIADERGNRVGRCGGSDAMLPPPEDDDAALLVRLADGAFYGTTLRIPIRECLGSAGRFTLRAFYRSNLDRAFVPLRLRALRALWSPSPTKASESIQLQIAN